MDHRSLRHFRAIANAFEQDAEARREEAMRLSPVARMSEGYELGRVRFGPKDTEAILDRRARAQAELHRRGRRLKVATP